MSGHIGQAITSALKLESKALVIDAQQVHDGGLVIVNMYRIFDDVVAKIIRFAVGKPFFHPSASHPDGVAARMVVSPIIVGGQFALGITAPAKFSTQITRVSSSSPRCLRSKISAAEA